jgi:hypothetical protein
MQEIREKYNLHKIVPSDIYEHIETLYQYGKQCKHITEMGVRWVSSTWAFLYSNPERLISYDIVKENNVVEVESLAKRNGLNFTFIEADVLKVEIEETDLLFIDTLHTYNQLYAELQKHSGCVRKYIVLHDTNTFGFKDEINDGKKSDLIENAEKTKEGLVNALIDFLASDNGIFWEIEKVFTNNNGLTIIKRK